MVRIDAGTAEEVAMCWIDRGACFFPVPKSGRKRKRGEPELEDGASSEVYERSDESSDTVESSIQPNLLPLSSTPRAAGLMCRLPWQCYIHAFESGMKRKRGEPELEYGASSGVDERSNESSDTVESGKVSKVASLGQGGEAGGDGQVLPGCYLSRSSSSEG